MDKLQMLLGMLQNASPQNIAIDEPIDGMEKDLLDVRGLPRIELHGTYLKYSDNQRALFCRKHGLYQLPTAELLMFLNHHISGRAAIEIGCGVGAVGRGLRIPITDSRSQEDPAIVAKYRAMGQPVIKYPDDVVKLTAAQAVAHYKPQVVIGCWITQLMKADYRLTPTGNATGVDEVLMLTEGFGGGHRPDLYVHVGNLGTHGDKELLNDSRLQVETIQAPWVVSRSMKTADNIIYIVARK